MKKARKSAVYILAAAALALLVATCGFFGDLDDLQEEVENRTRKTGLNAEAPTITGHPANAVYLVNDTAIPLTVEAVSPDDGTLSYQWYSNTVDSNTGGSSLGVGSGARTASFTPGTTSVATLYYYVVVTNTIEDNGDGGIKTATATSNTAMVVVDTKINAALPNITAHPLGATYSQNAEAFPLTVTASVTDGGTLSYQWFRNSTDSTIGGTSLGTGAQAASYTPATDSIFTWYYYVAVTNTIAENGDGGIKTATVYSNTAEITISTKVNAVAPNITEHPANGSYLQGAAATPLIVTASVTDGGTISYQWYSNTENNNTGGESLGSANGAQTASYLPGTGTLGTVYYYVVVTNTIPNNGDGGNKTAVSVSFAAEIKINTRIDAQTPNITGQPADAVYSQNDSVTPLTVTASVTDEGSLSFQWYSNTSKSNTGGTSLGSANGAQTRFYSLSTDDAGTFYYYVIVTNTIEDNHDGGTKTATARSNAVEIKVNAKVTAQIPTINGQPSGGIYTQNATASALTVYAYVTDGGVLSYQWYSNTTLSNTGGTPVAGIEAQALTFYPSTATAGTFYYFAEVTNRIADNGDGGNKTATARSNPVTVTVTEIVNAQTPNITGQPNGATYAQNQTVTTPLAVTASVTDGGTLSYQWYSNTSNSNSGGTSLGSLPGAQTASYLPSTATAGNLYYYVIVTNTITDNHDGGEKVKTATSNPALIVVNASVNAQPPNITGQPGSPTYTYGDTAPTGALSVSVTPVTDGGTLSYQWYSNTSANNSGGTQLGSANGAQTTSYTPQITAAGTFYYYVIVTNTINDNGDGGTKSVSNTSSVATVTVNKKTLYINSASHTKVYDGNPNLGTNAVTNVNFSGIVGSDSVSASSVGGSYTNKDVGSALNISGLTLAGAQAGNYTLGSITNPVTNNGGGITKKTITLTVPTPTYTMVPIDSTTDLAYRKSVPISVYSNDIISGDSVSISSSTNTYVPTASNASVSNSGSITLTYSGTGGAPSTTVTLTMAAHNNYTATNPSINVTVNILDGESVSYRIPVTSANIDLFNIYAASSAGLAKHYKLMASVTASDNWTPIGTLAAPFTGSFDGQNFVIRDITINNTALAYAGMFGYIGTTAGATSSIIDVERLGLEGCSIIGGTYTGGITGYLERNRKIQNCYVKGNVESGVTSGNSYAGGIAGYQYGITGYHDGNISSCYYAGGIGGTVAAGGNTPANSFAGGIVGTRNGGTLQNCYSTGAVTGIGYAGGIVGGNNYIMSKCFSTCSVTSTSGSAGGIAGFSPNAVTSRISDCAALNTSIKWISNAGRIISGLTTGSGGVGNCAGRDPMTFTPPRDASNPLDPGSATKDGVTVTAADYSTNATTFWGGTGSGYMAFSASTWSIANGRLPYLLNMPGTTNQPALP